MKNYKAFKRIWRMRKLKCNLDFYWITVLETMLVGFNSYIQKVVGSVQKFL